jgi:hypothetical protein
MQIAWRPLHYPSSLGVVFLVTLVVLLAAGAFFLRGVTELLGVSADGVLGRWQSLGFR